MAPICACIHTHSLSPPHISHQTSVSSGSFRRIRSQVVFCRNGGPNGQNLCIASDDKLERIQRRDVMLGSIFMGLSYAAIVPFAFAEGDVTEDFRLYSDDVNKFNILIPRDWQVGEGEGNGIKSVTAFYSEETANSNVSIVITGLGADFTRLESFGKVDAFAENLVSGLDRSWQRPPGVTAKLIDSKASNGLYYIEYTLQNPGESRRHLYSVLGVGNNGWNNRLYTLTGQFIEEEGEKYGSKIEKAVASFRLN